MHPQCCRDLDFHYNDVFYQKVYPVCPNALAIVVHRHDVFAFEYYFMIMQLNLRAL